MEKGAAVAITELIINELINVVLSIDNILSQVYHADSVMSRKYGEVQKLLQRRVGRQ